LSRFVAGGSSPTGSAAFSELRNRGGSGPLDERRTDAFRQLPRRSICPTNER
jgi:hypothetical protein